MRFGIGMSGSGHPGLEEESLTLSKGGVASGCGQACQERCRYETKCSQSLASEYSSISLGEEQVDSSLTMISDDDEIDSRWVEVCGPRP